MDAHFYELIDRLYKAIEKHNHLNNEEILKISRQIDFLIVQYYKDVKVIKELNLARNRNYSIV